MFIEEAILQRPSFYEERGTVLIGEITALTSGAVPFCEEEHAPQNQGQAGFLRAAVDFVKKIFQKVKEWFRNAVRWIAAKLGFVEKAELDRTKDDLEGVKRDLEAVRAAAEEQARYDRRVQKRANEAAERMELDLTLEIKKLNHNAKHASEDLERRAASMQRLYSRVKDLNKKIQELENQLRDSEIKDRESQNRISELEWKEKSMAKQIERLRQLNKERAVVFGQAQAAVEEVKQAQKDEPAKVEIVSRFTFAEKEVRGEELLSDLAFIMEAVRETLQDAKSREDLSHGSLADEYRQKLLSKHPSNHLFRLPGQPEKESMVPHPRSKVGRTNLEIGASNLQKAEKIAADFQKNIEQTMSSIAAAGNSPEKKAFLEAMLAVVQAAAQTMTRAVRDYVTMINEYTIKTK